VGDELSEHRAEVRLVERDQVVEALVPEGPHHPPGDGVGPWRPYGREDGLDTRSLRPGGEVAPVDRIPIPHEVPRPAAPGGGLDQLAPDPRRRRARRDADVDQFAPAVR
jgi:hypothetical protein